MPDLPSIWFLLIGVLLVGYAILDGLDLGAGTLHLLVARTDDERRSVFNAVGPIWDGNEVWLLTGGGAIFAAFPIVYATVFSGFYVALFLLLAALIVRAISLEFRNQHADPRWRLAWDVAFSVGSFVPALLFGVAIGNVVRGVPLDAAGDYRDGLLGLLNPFALVVGLLSVAMFVMQGGSWLALKTEGAVRDRSRRAAAVAWVAFVALWVVATAYARADVPGAWDNYANVAAWLVPVLFVVALGAYALAWRAARDGLAVVASSASIAGLIGILGVALYPNLVPVLGEPARNLTVSNASSSDLTLGVMLVVALVGMPLVLIYTAYVYYVFRGKVGTESHGY